mmetsp:Transcript_34883/g.84369  ORF Transcript_34883/g.84369 Transcript_34883/m.84369 type:complete len:214 (+) Transcript_34883:1505-2146(+)
MSCRMVPSRTFISSSLFGSFFASIQSITKTRLVTRPGTGNGITTRSRIFAGALSMARTAARRDSASCSKSNSGCILLMNSRRASNRGFWFGKAHPVTRKSLRHIFASRFITASIPLCCSLTATDLPLRFSLALCTCAIEAEATGSKLNSENISSWLAFSSSRIVSFTCSSGSASSASCSRFNCLVKALGRMSALPLIACPSLMYIPRVQRIVL